MHGDMVACSQATGTRAQDSPGVTGNGADCRSTSHPRRWHGPWRLPWSIARLVGPFRERLQQHRRIEFNWAGHAVAVVHGCDSLPSLP